MKVGDIITNGEVSWEIAKLGEVVKMICRKGLRYSETDYFSRGVVESAVGEGGGWELVPQKSRNFSSLYDKLNETV